MFQQCFPTATKLREGCTKKGKSMVFSKLSLGTKYTWFFLYENGQLMGETNFILGTNPKSKLFMAPHWTEKRFTWLKYLYWFFLRCLFKANIYKITCIKSTGNFRMVDIFITCTCLLGSKIVVFSSGEMRNKNDCFQP